MNTVKTFTFVPGLELRCIERDGAPWFVTADVCRALDMNLETGTSQWLAGLDTAERAALRRGDGEFLILFNGTANRVSIVSESGLYSLIMKSRKPQAQQFRKWVTSEVLPAIPGPLGHGKNGGYMTPEVAKLATHGPAAREDPAVFMARALVSSPP